MEHPLSILYGPVNHLLMVLFGASSVRWRELMGIHEAGYWLPDHVIMSALVVVLLAAVFIPVSRSLSVERPGRAQQVLELLVVGLRDLIEDVVGHGFGRQFLPFIAGLAVFIFVGNIFGLFFFVQPPTANPNTTFALSITAFLYYNVVGFKRNGFLNYLKQFVGPVWWLFLIMVPIEIISHFARILSLAIRLFGNIFGEHTATGIFFFLFPFVVPWPMMGLGIFGALLQAFIFIMLTMAYLNGAVAAEH